MADFLLLFRGGDGQNLQQSPEKWQEYMQLWMLWMADLNEQGKFMGAQPLKPQGRVIQAMGNNVTDGPFIENGGKVGGYLICKAVNYEEAVTIAKGCPVLTFDSGVVEVREIEEI